MSTDVVIVGAGLAGLAAAHELVRAGRRVTILDQENEHNLGGQAWWSFGGLFLVDTPEQRRLGIHDSHDLAWRDWEGTAGWDRRDGPSAEDEWGPRWARAFVEFASGPMRSWLHSLGIRFTPAVGWAERGGGLATGHGNSVPRFHVPWGTGTGISEPFADRIRAAAADGRVSLRHRHRVDELVTEAGRVVGVRGSVLAPDDSPRGVASSREVVDDFELRADAVVLATGGIGANADLVRRLWPSRLGTPPATMLTGVPAYVDGRMLGIAEGAGARVVNRDRMWHYTEGIRGWDPVWPGHGIRILPGPSSLWLDALGRRLPAPGLPGHDTLGTLRLLRTDPALQPHDHSWFVLTRRILEKEFALSGSEQNPDLTSGSRAEMVRTRLARGVPGPVRAFVRHGEDFVVARDLDALVRKMDRVGGSGLLDATTIREQIDARDGELANAAGKDVQLMSIRNARRSLGERLLRVAPPHRILDPAAGPLVAVRLRVVTRKTLGGLQTDLQGRVLGADGAPLEGVFAAGEVAGFGGGGVHGYSALEGTFLGGCLFTGRVVGRAIAAAG